MFQLNIKELTHLYFSDMQKQHGITVITGLGQKLITLTTSMFNPLKGKQAFSTTTLFLTCKLCEGSGGAPLLITSAITVITSKLKIAFT